MDFVFFLSQCFVLQAHIEMLFHYALSFYALIYETVTF